MDLLEFLDVAYAKRLKTIVLINDRTHYIFSDGDVIEEGWANLYKVSEIISEKSLSSFKSSALYFSVFFV